MAVFAKQRAVRAYQKRHMQFLATMEDWDLVLEIGWHQEQGKPLTMKQLYLLNVASMATVQRRLRRLRQLDVVVPRRADRDGRAVELTIHPRAMKSFRRYAELLAAEAPGVPEAG